MPVGKVHSVSKHTYTWALLTSPKSVLTPLLTLNSPVLALPFFGISPTCTVTRGRAWLGVPDPLSTAAGPAQVQKGGHGLASSSDLCLRTKLPDPTLSSPVWPWAPRQPVRFLNPIPKRSSGRAVSEEGPHGSNFSGW